MMLTVDCRPRAAEEIVPWTLSGIVAGTLWGAWRGSIADRKAREDLSSKRRKQRQQSKRRREQKGKTSKGRLVGRASSSRESDRRRAGDFKVGYSMQQGAMWGLLAGSTVGVGRAIWSAASGSLPVKEAQCRDEAVKRLKAHPSWDWGLLGAIGGALMYVTQIGSRHPLRHGDGEVDYVLLYSIVGGVGAWGLSEWFS